MSYEVLLRRDAQKELNAIRGRDYQAVARAVSSLREDARPPGAIKLKGSGLWRVRVGRYRLVYGIDDAKRLVIVVRVTRRREDTYEEL